MSDYIITKDGLVDTNSLQHWKYVKKKKVNGKWRYYYDDSYLKEAESNYKKAETDYTVSGGKLAAASLNQHSAIEARYKKGLVGVVSEEEVQRRTKAAESALATYSKNSAKFDKAFSKYRTAKIKDIAVGTIAKGVAAVANFFSGLFGGSKKKKKKKKK